MSSEKSVKFSARWDKLSKDKFKVGSVFTTFRGYRPGKEAYYTGLVGSEVNILVDGVKIGKARIVSINVGRVFDFSMNVLKSDTYQHWNKEDVERYFYFRYKNKNPICLVLELEVTAVISNGNSQ